MAPKRVLEDDAPAREAKKHRGGFKVGPDNLPDGTWRRKVIKIKKDLIHTAKLKKSYAKLKSREPPIDKPIPTDADANEEDDNSEASWEPAGEKDVKEPTQELHPSRLAMLSAPRSPTPPPSSHNHHSKHADKSHHIPNPNTDHASYPHPHPRPHASSASSKPQSQPPNRGTNRKPKYFEKEIAIAEKTKTEAAARREEWERNMGEKKRRIEERERVRRAMGKARTGGRNGQRKLGRESGVLLERVRRLVGDGK